MLSNRGNQYVKRIIPKLISDHFNQAPANGIDPIDLSTAENKLMHDWTLRSISRAVSEVQPEVWLDAIY
jgi:hypothetical protein